MNLLRKEKLVVAICIFLFITPFFWLAPGEIDIGGDSSRLYFYDPLSYLKTVAIYSVIPWGTGIITHNQYILPYSLLMAFLKFVFQSPTILIAIFNGLKLSGSFIFIYLIIRELTRGERKEGIGLPQYMAALLGGLFYTFSPAVLDNMKYALVTHDQVFVYPMMFYLLLLSLLRSSLKYVWAAIFISVLFSSSFVLYNPPLYAFFPLALIFLFIYNSFVLQKPIPLRGVVVSSLFFLGIHAFHIIPVLSNIFDRGSEFNTRVFESASEVNVGLERFNAILPFGRVSEHILLSLENPTISWSLVIIPGLVILGFLSNKGKNKTLFLVSIFFFITLFLVSANITQAGVEFYRKLFLIPGFGMFRNFFGQWQWIYVFFYALLAGLTVSCLFSRIKKKYIYFICLITIGFLVARSWIVFNGDIVNVINRGSVNVPVVMKIDPDYEKLLAYVKNISNDGKILHIPFTDFGYNLVGGSNGGVYVGKSIVSLLTQKKDFSGYQDIDPFSEVFVRLSREKNYSLIKQMMSLLQIRYVLYNSDMRVSDKFFPTFPYGYVGVPASSSAALDFAQNISREKIYEAGHYSLFEVNKEQYLPNFYIASDLFFYDVNPEYDAQYFKASSFFQTAKPRANDDNRIAYVDRQACGKILSKTICAKDSYRLTDENIQIIFQKINPTKYKVQIKNAAKPFLLVFQNSFTPKWKLYENGEELNKENGSSESYYNGNIVELNAISNFFDKNPFQTNSLKRVYADTHIEVNGYANAWYVDPGNFQTGDYSLIVEMAGQKMFYYSLIVSLITLTGFILYGIRIFRK